MVSAPNVTGLILAGGAGRRVGGADKGFIEWQGKPLIEHVYQRLDMQVSKIIISCNRNIAHYGQYATTTVTDRRDDYQGPLAGIEAAAPLIQTDLCVVVACDLPRLPTDLVNRLTRPFEDKDNGALDISYAHDGLRNQYLCAAISRSCLPSLSCFLDQGHRAVRDWFDSLNTVSVDYSEQRAAFSNHNGPISR
jgi:molybdopterin-guanine dinucleotide biosynthesis protein A